MEFSERCQELIEKGICSADCCGPVPMCSKTFEENKHKFQQKPSEIIAYINTKVALCEDGLCVFLNRETKRCMIYEDRPNICRFYGTGYNEDLLCQYIKPNGNLRSPAMVKRIKRKIGHFVDNSIRGHERRIKLKDEIAERNQSNV